MRKSVLFLTTMLLVAGFLWGLIELWRVRFAMGTGYPLYSSLRADPLGAKVLYDSLRRLPGIDVQRHYRPLSTLPAAPGTTLVLLGMTEWSLLSLPEASMQQLETFVQHGGRLVLALTASEPRWAQHAPAGEKAKQPAAGDTTPPPSDLPLLQRWGVRVHTPPSTTGQGPWTTRQGPAWSQPLPHAMVWHSPRVFTDVDAAWRVLYTREQQAVLIERDLGEGTIVLVADSYLFSNEAMWKARHTALVVRILAMPRRTVFDETHLGITEQAGVMTLVHTYRLQGVLLGLLLLAGLFVWRHASSLVPAVAPGTPGMATTVTGQDSASGLVHLLQRYVAAPDVLRLCLEEWHKAMPTTPPGMEAKLAQMRQVVTQYAAQPAGARHLLAGYAALCRILHTKR